MVLVFGALAAAHGAALTLARNLIEAAVPVEVVHAVGVHDVRDAPLLGLALAEAHARHLGVDEGAPGDHRVVDLEPVQAAKECNCRVYYMQYRVTYANLWDDLIRIIRPLEPKHFRVLTPMEMRRALATILAEIGSL